MLEIHALPGNDAPQGPAHGGPGAGKHGILQNGLPQQLAEKDRQGPVGIPESPLAFQHREAAQVFLLVENVHGQGTPPLQFQQQRLPNVDGHIVQGQERGHFFHVKGLGIQLVSQLIFQVIFLRDPQVAEIRSREQQGIFKNAPAGIQHLGKSCSVTEDGPELLLPAVVAVEDFLDQVEHPENVPAALHQNDAAPAIIGVEIPALAQANEAYILADPGVLRQVIRRADVDPVFLEGLGPVQVKFRTAQN